MSHIISLSLRIRRPEILGEVSRSLGLQVKGNTTVRFYSGTRTGTAIHLPGWKYPVVVDDEGVLHYDDYGGVWGDQEHLRRLIQAYVSAVVEAEARIAGQATWQEEREDGTLVLHVERW